MPQNDNARREAVKLGEVPLTCNLNTGEAAGQTVSLSLPEITSEIL